MARTDWNIARTNVIEHTDSAGSFRYLDRIRDTHLTRRGAFDVLAENLNFFRSTGLVVTVDMVKGYLVGMHKDGRVEVLEVIAPDR